MKSPVTRASAGCRKKHPLFAPGLKRRTRTVGEALYWMASPQAVSKGYTPKCLTLPDGLTEEEIATWCRRQWADLEGWRAGVLAGPTKHTISWLIDRYLKDDFSKFQGLRFNTQRNYAQDCEIIRHDIGERLIPPNGNEPRILGENVWRWHRKWGLPDGDSKPTAPSRARHLVTMLRIVIKHGVLLGVPGAAELAVILGTMEFPTTAPRSIAPDRTQVMAIVAKAIEMGYRSIAATTLAQFEFTERRISILGAWEGPQWRPGWTWQAISKDWIIRYTQNKRGIVLREYDLKDTPFLLDLLQQTPEEKRVGTVIVCETTGLPWREKHYSDTWRAIARAAEMPDELCSMDMRAGGATETDAIPGITERDIKASGGWKSNVFNRYTRAPQRRAQNVVKLRQPVK